MLNRARAFISRRRWAWWALAYAILLALSHLVIALWNPRPLAWRRAPDPAERLRVTIPAMDDHGPIAGRSIELSALRWPAPAGAERPPVILLHGSPSGGARDFRALGPRLRDTGRTVYAVDRPGWGESDLSPPRCSFEANARSILALMDELKIPRAHAVGWSYSGAVAVHMASLAPERLASITLLAGMGIQEAEGSGDYTFEHIKYAIGWLGVVALPEALPHFGLLGERARRIAFIRDFWECDQRPIRGLMKSLTTPTLVLHGRRDFLVPAWAAEEHHDLIGPSQLVMLDSGHFFPLGPPMAKAAEFEAGAAALSMFFAQADAPGAAIARSVADYRPDPDAAGPAKIGRIGITHQTHWSIVVLAIILFTLINEDLAVILVSLLIVRQHIDVGVGLLGCFCGIVIGDIGLWTLGRFVGRRVLHWPIINRWLNEESLERWGRVFDRHTGKAVLMSRCVPGLRAPTYLAAGILCRRPGPFFFWVGVAVFLWTPFLFILTAVVGRRVLEVFERVFHGPWAIIAALIVVVLVIRLVSYEATPLGRERLKADLKRLVSPEFWPPWIFYLPVAVYVLWLGLRHRSLTVWTCANPAIPMGGGVVGESKADILRLLDRADKDRVVEWTLIPEGRPADRAERVKRLVREDPRFGGYPVILKPDHAQRGHGLKLARNDHDVEEYFKDMTRAALLQRYSPGPRELGVLWARVPAPGRPVGEWPGEIFSITAKQFPAIEGDGASTLEQLIWRHPRYRMQAKVFLKRHDARRDLVLRAGETMTLAVSGNHCQGTMFTDGARVRSPALAAAVERIARAVRDRAGREGFDFGRFDVRYARDEDLAAEQPVFTIVELNGTMSESTNIYDPAMPLAAKYRVLFAQWRRLFEIGAARRAAGSRAMSIADLRAAVREHYHGRPGSPVAD